MGLYNLDKLFQPTSVAVIGASNKEKSLGRKLGFERKYERQHKTYRLTMDLT